MSLTDVDLSSWAREHYEPRGPMVTVIDPNPFRRALDGWDAAHWTQRALVTTDLFTGLRKVCGMGRIADVLGLSLKSSQTTVELFQTKEWAAISDSVVAAVRTWMPFSGTNGQNAIIHFNDEPATGFADVVKMFTKAAELWDTWEPPPPKTDPQEFINRFNLPEVKPVPVPDPGPLVSCGDGFFFTYSGMITIKFMVPEPQVPEITVPEDWGQELLVQKELMPA